MDILIIKMGERVCGVSFPDEETRNEQNAVLYECTR